MERPDTSGSLTLLDKVYAGRLLRQEVPPIVTASCLAWYGYWRRSNGGPSLRIFGALERSVEIWTSEPSQQSACEAQILAGAHQLAGVDPIAPENAAT